MGDAAGIRLAKEEIEKIVGEKVMIKKEIFDKMVFFFDKFLANIFLFSSLDCQANYQD
jgi:hypothetical protein